MLTVGSPGRSIHTRSTGHHRRPWGPGAQPSSRHLGQTINLLSCVHQLPQSFQEELASSWNSGHHSVLDLTDTLGQVLH